MNEIASAAQLDALPVRSIGIDEDGDAWQKFDDGWRAAFCDPTAEPNPSEVPPLTVLYRPDEPQRVQPNREAIRDELSGWPIGSGYYATAVGTGEAAEMADAVLALWPGRTEAEVKAEALREYAVEVQGGEVWTWDADRLADDLLGRADRLEAEARHG